MKKTILIFAILLFPALAWGAAIKPEKYYQAQWCGEQNGVMEFMLNDQTRVDCLTTEYAVEFDFASKWAEGAGQALYYAAKTDRTPGVVLILRRESDRRHIPKLTTLAYLYGIRIWIIEGWKE